MAVIVYYYFFACNNKGIEKEQNFLCDVRFIVILLKFIHTKMSDASKKEEVVLSFSEVMNKAAQSALRGGTAGAIAMGANVGALMWMRTTVSLSFGFGSRKATRISLFLNLFFLFVCACFLL